MGYQRIIQTFLQEYAPRKEISSTISNDNTLKDHCLLVVSSTSGFGNAARLAPLVASKLSDSFATVTVVPTTHGGHVYDIMNQEEKLSSKYEMVVILGGDGAFSEAVNGMLSRTDGESAKALAHCPGGSGCSTAGNTIGVWKGEDVERACDIICQRKVGKMDVIRVDVPGKDSPNYSISTVSGGNYTDIVDLADRYYRWTYRIFGPTARYVFGMIHALIKYGTRDNNRMARYTIATEDGKEEVLEVATHGFAIYNDGRVMEHARYSKATIGSGSLSLALDKRYLGLGKHLQYIGDLAKEKKLEGEAAENRVVRDKITAIRVEPTEQKTPNGRSPRPLTAQMDGERGRGNTEWMVAPFSLKVLPGKLNVIIA